jgi:hypothetical protein
MLGSDNLTGDYDHKRTLAATVKGMAHFAYTGPVNKHCGECLFWDWRDHYDPRYTHGGAKPSPCIKYQRLMNGLRGAPVPWQTPSCKYFDPDPNPFSRISGL